MIITTAGFMRDARVEATRDGATPIDLITGEELVEKLKDLGLGVGMKERVVQEVSIKREWFSSI